MTVHELGHVVVNGFFEPRDWQRAFGVFSSSAWWRDCFPAPQGSFDPCVGDDEILAEQIAFMGSPSWLRTSYKVPPLATPAQMSAILRRVG